MKEVSGRVIETMDSGGYTYALVEKQGTGTWVALPRSRIAVGNEISCQAGMVMQNFRSSSLNRTFEQIVFSSGITSISAGTADPVSEPEAEEPVVRQKVKESDDWGEFFDKK